MMKLVHCCLIFPLIYLNNFVQASFVQKNHKLTTYIFKIIIKMIFIWIKSCFSSLRFLIWHPDLSAKLEIYNVNSAYLNLTICYNRKYPLMTKIRARKGSTKVAWAFRCNCWHAWQLDENSQTPFSLGNATSFMNTLSRASLYLYVALSTLFSIIFDLPFLLMKMNMEKE